jgi:hypothetical protein
VENKSLIDRLEINANHITILIAIAVTLVFFVYFVRKRPSSQKTLSSGTRAKRFSTLATAIKALLTIAILVSASIFGYAWWQERDRVGTAYYATNCIKYEDMDDWSFRTFFNACNETVSALYCGRSAVGELLNPLVPSVGNEECETFIVGAGDSFMTIKWVNEQSSVASHILSTSRYRISACKLPRTPGYNGHQQLICRR